WVTAERWSACGDLPAGYGYPFCTICTGRPACGCERWTPVRPGTERQPAPAPAQDPAVQLGRGYEGVTFLASNCGCLPPDTNAAVGNSLVVETVNLQLRVSTRPQVRTCSMNRSPHSLARPLVAIRMCCMMTSPTAGAFRRLTPATLGCSWRCRWMATR